MWWEKQEKRTKRIKEKQDSLTFIFIRGEMCVFVQCIALSAWALRMFACCICTTVSWHVCIDDDDASSMHHTRWSLVVVCVCEWVISHRRMPAESASKYLSVICFCCDDDDDDSICLHWPVCSSSTDDVAHFFVSSPLECYTIFFSLCQCQMFFYVHMAMCDARDVALNRRRWHSRTRPFLLCLHHSQRHWLRCLSILRAHRCSNCVSTAKRLNAAVVEAVSTATTDNELRMIYGKPMI